MAVERDVLACVRAEDYPKALVPSVSRSCEACGRPIWLALEMRQPAADRNAILRCIRCAERIQANTYYVTP